MVRQEIAGKNDRGCPSVVVEQWTVAVKRLAQAESLEAF